MPQCAVVSCSNTHRKTKGGSVRYHRFPGDTTTRARWVQACGGHVQNCATARVCSRHFSDFSYERDVQHEILGLPTRCRLKKGAIPDRNVPGGKEERPFDSAIAILLAVGLVRAEQPSGGLTPQDLNKMHVMEDVREACDVQPSSPGHAEQGPETADLNPENGHSNSNSEEAKSVENEHCEHNGDKLNGKEDSDGKLSENESSNAKSESKMENGTNHIDDDTLSTDSAEGDTKNYKRKLDSDESATVKKLKSGIQENYALRDKILNEYIELGDCSTLEQMQTYTEQVVVEIKTLNELAKEKEREWNNIIHLKKLKEELLLRIQRRKQILLLTGDKNLCESEMTDSQLESLEERLTNSTSNGQSILKSNLLGSKNATLRIPNVNLSDKPGKKSLLNSALEMNGQSQDGRQFRQRPVIDVQSIIADYRQRHPEAVPRRGRRIRSVLNSQNENGGRHNSGSVLNFSSVALGSGAQVRQNVTSSGFDVNSELGLLLSAMDGVKDAARPLTSDSPPSHTSETSFRDMLVQFAKLSQNERHELIQNAIKPPPPYPEVTVHPVTTSPQPHTNSLLHGILTKTPPKSNNKTSFSPTLARLLTAPERAAVNSHTAHASPAAASATAAVAGGNVSISDILSTNKARNEITITPVGAQFEGSVKEKSAAQTEEDEAEDSADRLVIDEGGEAVDARNRATDANSDGSDDVPQCQGCNQRPAQFVCAGCGNQWYCSRDCQVSAWDEHSEVCSG